jgi:filamentous hemagglutinin
MAIGGSLDTNRQATGQATTLNNNSATVEALGSLDVGAKNINNTNEHFSYEIRLASQDDNASETISSTYYRTFVRKIYLPFNTSSDPANILSGGNMTLRSDTVTNMDSHIVAGGVLSSTGANMVNADVTTIKTIHDQGLNHNYVYVPQTGNCGFVKWNCVPGHYEWQTSPYEVSPQSTAYVPQPNAPQYSGKTITSVSAGSVSSNSLLPTSSVFKINVGATSSYLVTTDPRFTNHNLWLGSEFMMQSMSFDPTITQKRLGDGFYEQKLIREQVAQLTGRRFLGNYTSDQEEYQALMTNGLTTASALNLRPGIALTAAQMAQLTSDIVWIVEQSVTCLMAQHKKCSCRRCTCKCVRVI